MFIKSRYLIDKNAYNKKRSVCVSLPRKTKKQYHSKLNVKHIVDNYNFWEKIKTFFSDKSSIFKKISLIEQDRVTIGDTKMAEVFNDYFSNI